MKAALIADDLTGTNNAGVLVAKQSLTTMSVSYKQPVFPADCDVICVDTDSRYVDAQAAKQRVQEIAAWATGQGAETLCSRVDNLLRGNIGAELDAALEHLGGEAVAIVSPSFPALGRLIEDGHLLVNGVPVHENPVAAYDPFAPVRHSSIAEILAEQMNVDAAHITRKDTAFDVAGLKARLGKLIAGGTRVIIVDQSSDADVAALAQAMAETDARLVPVDPGPLSALYLRAVSDRLGQTGPAPKLLVAVGSVTDITLDQLRYFLAEREIKPVRLDPTQLIGDADSRKTALDKAIAATGAALNTKDICVVTTCGPDENPLDLAELAAPLGRTPHALSKQISDGLAEVIISTVEKSNGQITGCYVTGGDVVASLFEAAGVEAVRIFGDVIPLTAHVAFSGGRLDGLQLVTKGGSIGEEEALDRCVEHLHRALRKTSSKTIY